MFGDAKHPILSPMRCEIDDMLVVDLGLVGNRISQFETKPRSELDLLWIDARFLAKLSLSRFLPSLAEIEVTFGKIPSIRVLHQQKLPAWSTAEQENTRGLQGGYHFRLLATWVS